MLPHFYDLGQSLYHAKNWEKPLSSVKTPYQIFHYQGQIRLVLGMFKCFRCRVGTWGFGRHRFKCKKGQRLYPYLPSEFWKIQISSIKERNHRGPRIFGMPGGPNRSLWTRRKRSRTSSITNKKRRILVFSKLTNITMETCNIYSFK